MEGMAFNPLGVRMKVKGDNRRRGEERRGEERLPDWDLGFDHAVHLCQAVLPFEYVIDVLEVVCAPGVGSAMDVLYNCMPFRSNLENKEIKCYHSWPCNASKRGKKGDADSKNLPPSLIKCACGLLVSKT